MLDCPDWRYTKHKILPRTAPCNGVWTVLGSYPCSYACARRCTRSPQPFPSKGADIHQAVQRSRALTPLNTPPTTGSFNSPWPSMSGAGKRNRACERATPYPPGQCPHAPGLGGERLGGHPPLGCTASGEGGRGPRRGAKPPAGTPARTPAFCRFCCLLLLYICFYLLLFACSPLARGPGHIEARGVADLRAV